MSAEGYCSYLIRMKNRVWDGFPPGYKDGSEMMLCHDGQRKETNVLCPE